jgi:transcriptional regulator with XRE-family HTH domain
MVSDVGRRIIRARELAGVSSRELSMLANRSHSALGHVERGVQSGVRISTLVEVSRVLGVSLEWLANGAGPEPTVAQVTAAVERAREAAVTKGAA